MLVCKKCFHAVAERTAQQSFCEMEAVLLERHPVIAARRKAMNYGPLCDACLAHWQDKQHDVPPAESQPPLASPSVRSALLEKLEADCIRMPPHPLATPEANTEAHQANIASSDRKHREQQQPKTSQGE